MVRAWIKARKEMFNPWNDVKIERFLALSASMLFLFSSSAQAQLPAASYQTAIGISYLVTSNDDGSTPQSLSISTNIILSPSLYYNESFNANAGPGPYANVSGTLSPVAYQYNYGSADAVVLYDLQLNGPIGTKGSMIPISLAGSLDVSVTPLKSGDTGYGSIYESAVAFVTIDTGNSGVYSIEAYTTSATSLPNVYNTGPFTGSFNMMVGAPYVVQCTAQLILNGTSPDAVTGSATVDPTFTLASNYLAAGYSLVYSSGLTIPPQLAITASGTNVIVTWPTNAAGFTLQSTTNLSSAVWLTNTSSPIVIFTNNVVTNFISGTQEYYRLKQ